MKNRKLPFPDKKLLFLHKIKISLETKQKMHFETAIYKYFHENLKIVSVC